MPSASSPIQPAPDSPLDPVALQSRQVELVFRLLPVSLWLSFLLPLPVAYLLRLTSDHQTLALWTGVLWVVTAVRYAGVMAYRRAPDRLTNPARWTRWFAIGTAVAGLCWSAIGTVLFPANEVWTRTVLGFVVAGIAAISLVTIGSLVSAYRAFMISMLLPIAVYQGTRGNPESVAIGIAALGFAVALLAVSHRVAHNAMVTLRATATSEELAARLARAIDDTRAKNVALLREVAERERAQAHALQSDARLRLALESAGMTSWEFELSERRLTITGGQGGEVGEASGTEGLLTFLEFVHPEDRAHLEQQIAAASGADVFRAEVRMRNRGMWRWIAAHGRVLPGDARTKRMIGVAQDVTRRKAAQAELEAAKGHAEAASRAKSQFLATMSHEIRTPLNGVVGMLELINDSDLTPAQRRMAEAASRSCEALLAVINNILDLSKIEANRLEIEAIPFDCARLVADVAALLADAAERKHLALTCQVAGDLPHVVGDPNRLRQVLINLVSNAVKFTERGEVTVSLSALERARPGQVTLRFVVRDTGIGLTDAEARRLFQPFTQADMSTSRRYGGTGLGLAISRQLVELMGGTIFVESAPGQGSTFTVDVMLPVTSPPAERSETRHSTVVPSARILVVEDHPLNRQVAIAMLTRMGCRVQLASSGAEAVAAAKDTTFDLVLMDCQMPDVDGYEASRRIRAHEAGTATRVPIVALTANALRGDRERCLEAGMDDYLTKPFTASSLRDMVLRWTAAPPMSPDEPASVVPPPSDDVLDPAALSEVRAIDADGSLLVQIVGIFQTDGARLLDDAQRAVAIGEIERFVFAVHTLKSCSGSVGARHVMDRCAVMERQARTAGTLPDPNELNQLAMCFEQACHALGAVTGGPRQTASVAG